MATRGRKQKPPGRPAKKKSARSEPTQLPLDIGKLEAPRERSERRAQQSPKQYPPIPPGKKLIFRWTRVDPRTGQTIRAHGRPFPILVDA